MTDTTKPARKSWTKVAFGDVVQLARERSSDPEADGHERFIGLEHIDPGDLRVRRWGNIADGVTFTNVFKPGQVLFGKRRAYQRKVAVADFGGVCSSDIYVLEPKGEDLLPELLPFICQTDAFFEHAVGTSAGSLSPRTNWDSLATFEFALPPIEEQRRSMAVLDAGLALEYRMQSAAEGARRMQAALFEHMTDPREVELVELGALLTEAPRNGCSAQPASVPTGHWVLALSAITPWGYRPGEVKPVEPTQPMMAAKISRGELFISRSNTRDRVGLPMIFEEERDDVSYPDTMMRLRFDLDRVDLRFMECALRSRRCREQIESLAAGTSASMKKISGANLRRVRVPLPSLDVQCRFNSASSLCRSGLEMITARAVAARQVMSAVMNQMAARGR
ncbi:MAG: restriction endonuclease subunit S [Planctomycetes bacterium]|nr:restriction endonuclease subunit S [Planctomycetota bacterium]